MSDHYILERRIGFTRLLWPIRARLTDTETGETIELRKRALGEELCELLDGLDAGQLDPLPADASPFFRYESRAVLDGWHYLDHGEGALNYDSFARTKSEAFARRAVEALNRGNPRRLRDEHGPFRARWF